MKRLLQFNLIFAFLLISIKLIGQSTVLTREVPGAKLQTSQAKKPSKGLLSEVHLDQGNCLSETEQKEIQKKIDKNVEMLKHKNPGLFNRSSGINIPHPYFEWPTRAKAGFTGYGYYTVNFLVDHNAGYPNQLLDYDCGSRTYDWNTGNHAGTDIILWPYAWRRMDEQVMEVIAAAPGIIVNKVDGNFDRNCSNNGSGTFNQINVRHADGSTAWYLHFKSGSLTAKSVGDSVVTGEYLGTAGSSGSSNWPHLHFQVMDSTNALIDPWQGSCNNMNPDSWWLSQQPYNVPSINQICTKKTSVDYYICPTPEITAEADTFNIGDTLWLWIYTRDLVLNSNMQINIYNPSGANVLNFPFTVPWATTATTYIRWYYPVDAWFVQGNWTFEVVYGGNTYQHNFYMTQSVSGIIDVGSIADFNVSPNPSDGNIKVTFSNQNISNATIEIKNMLGDLVYKEDEIIKSGNNDILINDLKLDNGVYFLQLKLDNKTATKKIVIQN